MMHSMIRKLILMALSNKKLLTYLRDIYSESRFKATPDETIAEVQPLNCQKSEMDAPRLNLLVPALSDKHVFGGIATALDFFETLGKKYQNLRIILTDEQNFSHENNASYSNWEICPLNSKDGPGKKIVVAGDRFGFILPVAPNDRFVATAWWTAVFANHIQKWQAETYALPEPAKFVYLIQDFEPGFYPWSSRYALAEATYHDTDRLIAVFNTGLLKSFFDAEGYKFKHAHVFEPFFHPKLQQESARLQSAKKERRVVVYGRPSVERNAFQIIIMALKEWVARNPESDWVFVSAGEAHQAISLGFGKRLVSLGKLSLNDYAAELAKSSIGISLMISPHPSYPPLEMAAFGMRVITNRFKTKDLSQMTSRIVSIDSVSPSNLADALDMCIATAQLKSMADTTKSSSLAWESFIKSKGGFHGIPSAVWAALDPEGLK